MKQHATLLLLVSLLGLGQLRAQAPSCMQAKQALNSASLYYSPENKRSDTIDVLHYSIHLDITDFANQRISGYTGIRFAPKISGQQQLRLDLLKLTIDSIRLASAVLTYTYNDTLLNIHLPNTLNTTDTAEVLVYYHGKPQGDPTGWGGFYFSGNYAFNLGVGFGANPHNYGRVWFPCFDNFVEKSSYDFNILTVASKAAYCNGALVSDVPSGANRLRRWELQEQIPSYLASVTVADYTQVNWSMPALNGTLPITLVARPSDTTNLKNSFVHLTNCIAGYETHYGPYAWNRVGYCLVPFGSGAMEHATNITYPLSAANGSTASEAELMAHELSHHWWGDLVTCETAEDMWINEGMATFSAFLFTDFQYGHDLYMADVRANHDDLLHLTHLKEGGFRAISGVPHQYTYGEHVYNKGADVAHTLRGYMGDAGFFIGLQYVLQQKAFGTMNSTEFENLLTTSWGQNLNDFFNDWVLHGGWPHFSIDSVKVSGAAAPYTAVIHVKQKRYGAPNYFNNVPLEVSFLDAQWNKAVRTVTMNGAVGSFTVQLPFMPVYAGMNLEGKISDAISSEIQVIKSTGTYNFNLGRANLQVSNAGADSSFIRIEHNYAGPDAIKSNPLAYRLTPNRYWKIDGILANGFVSKLRLNYDGNKVQNSSSYMDTSLTVVNGDSLILLYRRDAGDDWKEVRYYTKTKTGPRSGILLADTLKLGEYAFANGLSTVVGIQEVKHTTTTDLQVFPNPSTETIHVTLKNYVPDGEGVLEIFSAQGVLIHKERIIAAEMSVSAVGFMPGTYMVRVIEKGKMTTAKRVVVK